VSTTANKSSQLAKLKTSTQTTKLAWIIATTIYFPLALEVSIPLETTLWDADCITILPFQLSELIIVLTLILLALEFADLIAKFTVI